MTSGRVLTTKADSGVFSSRPDFGGGILVYNDDAIYRLHPLTGAATALYTNANNETQSVGLSEPATRHPLREVDVQFRRDDAR